MLRSVLFIVCCWSIACQAQQPPAQPIKPTATDSQAVQESIEVREAVADDNFHRGIVKAAHSLFQKGTISRGEYIRFRVAMLSPAFRKHARHVAVTQMAFSGDKVPETGAGDIDETAIDWNALAEFLEKMVPILLMLLEIFSKGSI